MGGITLQTLSYYIFTESKQCAICGGPDTYIVEQNSERRNKPPQICQISVLQRRRSKSTEDGEPY